MKAPTFEAFLEALAAQNGGLPRADDSIIQELARETFTAATLCRVARISYTTLTNISSKFPLIFCSEPMGHGRPRQFCLVDVYQTSLFGALTSLGETATAASDIANRLLFPDLYCQREGGNLTFYSDIRHLPETDERRRALRENPLGNLPPTYVERGGMPWFLVARPGGDWVSLSGDAPFFCERAGRDVFDAMMTGCLMLNLTRLLNRVDGELAAATGRVWHAHDPFEE